MDEKHIEVHEMSEAGIADVMALQDGELEINEYYKIGADKQRQLLNASHDNIKIRSFIGYCDGIPCTHLTAILDDFAVKALGESVGFFTNFISRDNAPCVQAVFDRARQWLRSIGARVLRGPMSAKLADPRGILIAGFEEPPCLGLAHNPPYYGSLITAAGLSKVMDMFSYRIKTETLTKVSRVASIVKLRLPGVKIRDFEPSREAEEIADIVRIYNNAWQHHWSFIPVTEKDLTGMLDAMRGFFDPEMAKIATVRGRSIGIMVSVPNMFDPEVQRSGRRKHARAMLFGVDCGFQKRGIDALLMESAVQMAKSKGIDAYEVGWVLESNIHWRKQLETACGPSMTGHRQYRIYEQTV